MAEQIGIVGFSGTGKSSSLRNLDPKETFVITPSKDSLPFKGAKKNYTFTKNPMIKVGEEDDKGNPGGNVVKTKDLSKMAKCLEIISTHRPEIKVVVVEDFTHFLNAYTLSDAFRGQSSGGAAWSRWSDFGANVFAALFKNQEALRDDLTIVHMFHPEMTMTPQGERLKIKTPGNLLEREVDIPSYYTYMLYTHVIPVDAVDPQPAGERYKFVTNDDGYYPAKTPMGLVEGLYVENDLNLIIEAIKNY